MPNSSTTRLAQVEAKVHGVPVEQIHFHEVGALDAIVDVVGVAAGLHALGITELYASSVPLGSGWTQSAHGALPLPAPATLELLASVQAPIYPAPGPGELITPTGAALLAQYATFRQPAMRLQRIGYGAGQREFTWPNLARLWLGEAGDSRTTTSAPRREHGPDRHQHRRHEPGAISVSQPAPFCRRRPCRVAHTRSR